MVKSYSLLKPLTDQLMDEVRAYGILEVSLEQYQTVCNSIVRLHSHHRWIPTRTILIQGALLVRYAGNIIDSNCALCVCCLRLRKEASLIFRALNLIRSSTLYPTRQTTLLKWYLTVTLSVLQQKTISGLPPDIFCGMWTSSKFYT